MAGSKSPQVLTKVFVAGCFEFIGASVTFAARDQLSGFVSFSLTWQVFIVYAQVKAQVFQFAFTEPGEHFAPLDAVCAVRVFWRG